jgi:hypothetical protein
MICDECETVNHFLKHGCIPKWPFPGPSGPIPWTPEQIKQYEQQKREQVGEAKW